MKNEEKLYLVLTSELVLTSFSVKIFFTHYLNAEGSLVYNIFKYFLF